MDEGIERALHTSGVIDITTVGRRTGLPRRIEIFMHAFDGRIIISGRPMAGRTRAWIRNLEADPSIMIHLKRGVTADLPGTARIVTDAAERRELIARVAHAWRRTDVDEMVAHSPLIEVTLPDFPG